MDEVDVKRHAQQVIGAGVNHRTFSLRFAARRASAAVRDVVSHAAHALRSQVAIHGFLNECGCAKFGEVAHLLIAAANCS